MTTNAYREYVDKVRAATALAAVLAERYDRPVGADKMILCPFHSDNNPSCSVSNDLYHCFACHASGDVFTLVMGLEGLTFPRAVDQLAGWAGLPVYRPTAKDQQVVLDARAVEAATETAASYYEAKLTPEARDYLMDQRGLPAAVIQAARLGWADGALVASLGSALGVDVLVQAGLARATRNASTWGAAPLARDLLERRIVFPALVSGQARFLVGRAFDPGQEPKYFNQKRAEAPLYNQDALVPGANVVVTEGPVDALSLTAWGLRTVALLGTLHRGVVARLKRAGSLLCCLDADPAGRQGVYRLAAAVGPHRVKVFTLPEGQDPNDYARTHKPGQFMAIMQAARDPIQFLLSEVDPTQVEPGALGARLAPFYKMLGALSHEDAELAFAGPVTAWAGGRKALVKAMQRTWREAAGQFECPGCGTLLVRPAL